MEKIFIVSNHIDKCIETAESVVGINDDLNIANLFISDNDSIKNKHFYYENNEQIGLDYLNNSLLFVTNRDSDYINYGITIDELYNNDIVCLEYCDFLNISDYIFDEMDIIVVWIDDHVNSVRQIDCINESAFADTIYKLSCPVLYFSGDDDINMVSSVINEYLNADDDRKNEIINENS